LKLQVKCICRAGLRIESSMAASYFSDPRWFLFGLLGLSFINANPLDYKEPLQAPARETIEYLDRFPAVKEYIGAPQQLGYASDVEEKAISADRGTETVMIDMPSLRNFFEAEYALAPNILVYGLVRSKILGNFSSVQRGREFAKKSKLKIEKDFGNGLFIYSNEKSES
jgi:hypothetical protein